MRSPPYPSDLTNEQWSLLEPLISRAARNCRPRKTDLREVVNAIFYLNRAGCPWRMLLRDFPPWRTVYNDFEGWRSQRHSARTSRRCPSSLGYGPDHSRVPFVSLRGTA